MATEADVVGQLVRITEAGSLKWKPVMWDGDGVATGWATTKSDYHFTVYDYHKNDRRLYVNTPESRASVQLVDSMVLDGLVEVLRAAYKIESPNRDAVLGMVLESLSKS